MRTITATQIIRLRAQADEAKLLKLNKTASNINAVIAEQPSRPDSAQYLYTRAELEQDVERLLWKSALRVADYLGKDVDAKLVQEAVSDVADDFIREIMARAGVPDGVGAYEPMVPGEARKHTVLEVEDTE